MIKLLFHLKHRNFQRLWIAQLISQFGDRIHQLALIGLIAERSVGSVSQLTKVIMFTILPVFIIQPLAGVLVDRLDRRMTLFICDIFRGVLVLTIPFYFIYQESMLPIYIMVFIVFSFSRFYVPAKMSIVPDLVPNEKLIAANSLISSTGLIAFVLGAAIGGFFIEEYGSRNGFLIDSLTFFCSAMFLWSMNMKWKFKINADSFRQAEVIALDASKTIWQDMREGFDYLIGHKEIRFVLNMIFILLAAAGASYVVLVVFIQETFGSVTKDLGVLAVALGGGLFIGFMAYGKWGAKVKWHQTIFVCLLLGGVMMMAFAGFVHMYPQLWMAIVLAIVWGIVIGPIFIASNTVVQMMSSDEMRGKMFSALEIVIHLAFLLAMLLSWWLSTFVATVWILMGVGGAVTLVSILGLIKPDTDWEGDNRISEELSGL